MNIISNFSACQKRGQVRLGYQFPHCTVSVTRVIARCDSRQLCRGKDGDPDGTSPVFVSVTLTELSCRKMDPVRFIFRNETKWESVSGFLTKERFQQLSILNKTVKSICRQDILWAKVAIWQRLQRNHFQPFLVIGCFLA